MIQKTNKNIPRRNKYILENISLNIFKFYILKYFIKFHQSHDNNKKKNSAFVSITQGEPKVSSNLFLQQDIKIKITSDLFQ